MHILLVEDSGILANLFQVQLKMIGPHSVTITATMKEALSAFEQETFDLIFIDIGLEGYSDRGIQILTEIKRLSPRQRVGILSSNDLREMVQLSQQAGAEFYVVKPFTMEGLAVILGGNKTAIQNYQPDINEGRIIAF